MMYNASEDVHSRPPSSKVFLGAYSSVACLSRERLSWKPSATQSLRMRTQETRRLNAWFRVVHRVSLLHGFYLERMPRAWRIWGVDFMAKGSPLRVAVGLSLSSFFTPWARIVLDYYVLLWRSVEYWNRYTFPLFSQGVFNKLPVFATMLQCK